MGQAKLDLPDPLSQPANGSAVNADDLLSQLAGDEIDRLLSEAEVDPPEDEAAPPDRSPPATEEALHQELDDLHAALQQTDLPPAGDGPQSAGPICDLPTPQVQAQLSTELDQLFDAINQPEPSPPPADLPQVEESAPLAEESIPAAAPEPSEEQAATTRLSSTLRLRPEGSSLKSAALLESIEPTTPPAPLPIWLRPLEWLNAPLAGLSDSARSALGKAALITLFNAIVVLLYVLLFRK